jgi:peroxiredoxin
MARTPSTMAPLQSPAPPFALPDPAGTIHTLDDFREAPALLVVFLSNHCPFVKHIRGGLADFAREYRERGLAVVAIGSNDIERYPADAPELMSVEVREHGYTFPYLFDESQEVAKAYGAACTPDFFLYDGERRLAYRGQFDGSRPGNDIPVTGADLRAAAEAVLEGRPTPQDQRPSLGCNIKWKPGNEPACFGG